MLYQDSTLLMKRNHYPITKTNNGYFVSRVAGPSRVGVSSWVTIYRTVRVAAGEVGGGGEGRVGVPVENFYFWPNNDGGCGAGRQGWVITVPRNRSQPQVELTHGGAGAGCRFVTVTAPSIPQHSDIWNK